MALESACKMVNIALTESHVKHLKFTIIRFWRRFTVAVGTCCSITLPPIHCYRCVVGHIQIHTHTTPSILDAALSTSRERAQIKNVNKQKIKKNIRRVIIIEVANLKCFSSRKIVSFRFFLFRSYLVVCRRNIIANIQCSPASLVIP